MATQQLGYNQSGNIGPLAIFDSRGGVAYYPDYVTALAGAKSGDTIIQLQDLVLDKILYLKNGVNINLNGFTLEFKTGAYITGSGSSATCNLINGKVKSASGYVIYTLQGWSYITLTTNCVFEGAIYSNNTLTLMGGVYIGTSFGSITMVNYGFLYNIISYSFVSSVPTGGANNCMFLSGVYTSSPLNNCFCYSSGGYAIGIENSPTCRITNCIAISTSTVAYANVYGTGTHTNLIAISTASWAIATGFGCTLNNVFAYSTANYAFGSQTGTVGGSSVNSSFNTVFNGGTLISTAAAVCSPSNSANSFYETVFDCQWNNVNGHCLYNPSTVVGCILKVTNPNAKCILSSVGNYGVYYLQNIFKGSQTPVDPNNITQLQQNTPDLFGNISIG